MSHNIIGNVGAEAVASNLLRTWNMISFLNVSGSDIGDDAVRVIAEVLTVNRHLKGIDFSNNPHITDVGGREILQCIYNTESFSTLINSNHVLASCSFNGCQLTKKLKRRIGKLFNQMSLQLSSNPIHYLSRFILTWPFHRLLLRGQNTL